MKKEKSQYICPHCKADLLEVGLINSQRGWQYWTCEINPETKEVDNFDSDGEFESDDGGDYNCRNCGNEIDLNKLNINY